MNDQIRRAWRKAPEERTAADREALREYERMKAEEETRPRMTKATHLAGEALAKARGQSFAAFLNHLIQREAAGEVIDVKVHQAKIKDSEANLLEAVRELDRVERKMDAEKEKAREARAYAQQVTDAWLHSIEIRMRELDFAGLPEPRGEDFLGPSGNDTANHGGARAHG